MSASDQFEEYVRKFATQHNIDPEEAINRKIVKEYKAWICKELDNDNTRKENISTKI